MIDYELLKLCAIGALIGSSAYCFFYVIYKIIEEWKH